MLTHQIRLHLLDSTECPARAALALILHRSGVCSSPIYVACDLERQVRKIHLPKSFVGWHIVCEPLFELLPCPIAELGGAEFCQKVLLLQLTCFGDVLFENGTAVSILINTIVHSSMFLLPRLPCLVGNSHSRSNQQRRLDKHDADERVR